jgi:hypothetical protein
MTTLAEHHFAVDSFFNGAVFDQVKYRGKGFVLHYLVVVFHLGNTRLYITARCITSPFQLTAFNHKVAAFGFAFFNRIKVKRNRVGINQRPHVVMLIQRVTNPDLPVSAYQFCLKAS